MSYSEKTIRLIKYLDKSLHKELEPLRQTNSFDMNILTAKIGEARLIDQKTIDKCLLRYDRVRYLMIILTLLMKILSLGGILVSLR